jgi:ketol-acid reductoisomerase
MNEQVKVFYDADADLSCLAGKGVGIVGYGIQGRAQALNLRDAGVKVRVGNRKDEYVPAIRADGFEAQSIEEVSRESDIVLLLIPDQAHAEVYSGQIEPRLRSGGALVVAHGYSLRFGSIKPRSDLDVMLLAPRMPGKQIREYYLRGSGVPAFVDVVRDASGGAWPILLALAKGMGFTRSGALRVSLGEETEIDLFVEQFLVPTILRAIHLSFDELVAAGYEAVPALMELYASGELGEVLLMAAKLGLYGTFQKNSSPTCQFGIASNYSDASESEVRQKISRVIEQIRSGRFAAALETEGNAGYPRTNGLWDEVARSPLAETERKLRQLIRGESG